MTDRFATFHDLEAASETLGITIEELEAATSFGPMMAARLAEQIFDVIDQSMSTMTGA